MPLKHWYMRVKDWFKETGVPPKGVRLVETIEPTVEDRGGFTIVIRGAFNRLVGRESQPSIDEVAANEFGVVRVYLNEAVQSEDEITVYVHESHVTRELHESAVTSDGVTYSIAEVYTETLTEVQSSSDEITYNVITAVITKHFEETADSSDSISYTVFERVVLSFSETAGQANDNISSSVATRSVYRYLEKQYQNEIGTAYVPQGDETLEIKALTELQSITEASSVSEFAALYETFDESQSVEDAISVNVQPVSGGGFSNWWLAAYLVEITKQYSEEQSSSDSLSTGVANLVSEQFDESQSATDEITYYTTETTAWPDHWWVAEYETGGGG